ncbi:hypothetical protein GCM10009808_13460 [Microbacterium sediminicola]|uniref:Uncharacterized protein n=1 Tax=Microbacterium sediminicola TaxID=415210 RepID=A0ABP4U1X3_9MICO
MDAKLVSDLIMAVIGILALGTIVGVVGAFWSMGRAAYRKD